MIEFTWDEEKNIKNIKKHDGISFEQAQTVFFDDAALLTYDQDHSENEERYILLGNSKNGLLLLVCHTHEEEISGVETVRIISARKATSKEASQYYKRNNV